MRKNNGLKKLLACMLSVSMVLQFAPTVSYASEIEETPEKSGGGAIENCLSDEVVQTDAYVAPGLNIDTSVSSSGTGWNYNSSTRTLTLNNYSGTTPIYYGTEGSESNMLYISLSGTNTITGSTGAGIVTYGSTVIKGSGSLIIDDAYRGIHAYNNLEISSGNITISNTTYGIDVKNAVSGEDSGYYFRMTGGSLDVSARLAAIQYMDLTLNGGSAKFASTNEPAIYVKTGSIRVKNASLTAITEAAAKDAIHTTVLTLDEGAELIAKGGTGVYLNGYRSGAEAENQSFSIWSGAKTYIEGKTYGVNGCNGAKIVSRGGRADICGGTSAINFSVFSGIDSGNDDGVYYGKNAGNLSTDIAASNGYLRINEGYIPEGMQDTPDDRTWESIHIAEYTQDFEGNGVSYVASTRTLTLENVTVTGTISLDDDNDPNAAYTVKLLGENTLAPTVDEGILAIAAFTPLTLTGNGKAVISSTESAQYVIHGNGKLTVDGPSIEVTGQDNMISCIYAPQFEMKSGSIDVKNCPSTGIAAKESMLISGGAVKVDNSQSLSPALWVSGDSGTFRMTGGNVELTAHETTDGMVSDDCGVSSTDFTMDGGTLNIKGTYGLELGGTATVNGGTLTIQSVMAGVDFIPNGSVTFNGGKTTITSKSSYAIASGNTVTFGSNVTAKAGSSASSASVITKYSNAKYLNVEGSAVETPDEPGLRIDTSVSSSGTGWSYNSSTRTLTLNNYNGTTPIYYGTEGSESKTLYISLSGTNTISPGASAPGIVTYGNTVVKGSGSLTISNALQGIYVYDNLEISSGNITISNATYGIDVKNAVSGEDSGYHLRMTGGSLDVGADQQAIRYLELDLTGGTAKFESASAEAVYVNTGSINLKNASLTAIAKASGQNAIHTTILTLDEGSVLIAKGGNGIYLNGYDESAEEYKGGFSIWAGAKAYIEGKTYAFTGCPTSNGRSPGVVIKGGNADIFGGRDAFGGSSSWSKVLCGGNSVQCGWDADSLEYDDYFSSSDRYVRINDGYNPDNPTGNDRTWESITITSATTDFAEKGVSYTASTRTLTLEDVTVKDYIQFGDSSSYTLEFLGENTLQAETCAIEAMGSLTLKGSGKAVMSSERAGNYVITAQGKLTIAGPSLEASGSNYSSACIGASQFEMKSGSIDLKDCYYAGIAATRSMLISGGTIKVDNSQSLSPALWVSGDSGTFRMTGGNVELIAHETTDGTFSDDCGVNSTDFTMDGGTLDIKGTFGLELGGTATVNGGTLTIQSVMEGVSFYKKGSVIFNGGQTTITSKSNYAIASGNTVTFGSNVTAKAGSSASTASAITTYSNAKYLSVEEGSSVTPDEPGIIIDTNVSSSGTGWSYDATKLMLTLDNYNGAGPICFGQEGDRNLSILLVGDNVIRPGSTEPGLVLYGATLVHHSTGTLTIDGAYQGIDLYSYLLIGDAKITIKNAKYGIDGNTKSSDEPSVSVSGGQLDVSSELAAIQNVTDVSVDDGGKASFVSKQDTAVSTSKGIYVTQASSLTAVSEASSGKYAIIAPYFRVGGLYDSPSSELIAKGPVGVFLNGTVGTDNNPPFAIQKNAKIYIEGKTYGVQGRSGAYLTFQMGDADICGGTFAIDPLSNMQNVTDEGSTVYYGESGSSLTETVDLYAPYMRVNKGYNPDGTIEEPQKETVLSTQLVLDSRTADFQQGGCSYNAVARTLTLNNVNLSKGLKVDSGLQDLTIVLRGKNTFGKTASDTAALSGPRLLRLKGTGEAVIVGDGSSSYKNCGILGNELVIDGPKISFSDAINVIRVTKMDLRSGQLRIESDASSLITASESILVSGGILNIEQQGVTGTAVTTSKFVMRDGEVNLTGVAANSGSGNRNTGVRCSDFVMNGGTFRAKEYVGVAAGHSVTVNGGVLDIYGTSEGTVMEMSSDDEDDEEEVQNVTFNGGTATVLGDVNAISPNANIVLGKGVKAKAGNNANDAVSIRQYGLPVKYLSVTGKTKVDPVDNELSVESSSTDTKEILWQQKAKNGKYPNKIASLRSKAMDGSVTVIVGSKIQLPTLQDPKNALTCTSITGTDAKGKPVLKISKKGVLTAAKVGDGEVTFRVSENGENYTYTQKYHVIAPAFEQKSQKILATDTQGCIVRLDEKTTLDQFAFYIGKTKITESTPYIYYKKMKVNGVKTSVPMYKVTLVEAGKSVKVTPLNDAYSGTVTVKATYMNKSYSAKVKIAKK